MNGRNIVLIVEDDVWLAETACEICGLAGYVAIHRASVADALDYLSRSAGQIAVLLTDVSLDTPMNGIDLAVHVAQEWPDIRICVTSGVEPERSQRLPSHVTFLPKPWRSGEVIAAIGGRFDGTSAAG